MAQTDSSATKSTSHEAIRKWVEERGGYPAMVADTQWNGRAGGVLRIDFDDPGGNDDPGLRRINWQEFFKVFDESDLAFLRVEDGNSRFSKFIQRQEENA